jgi:hypothetical protein
MDPDEPPRPDALRLGRTGDVEIFDGTAWQPVSSLLKDPATGSREEPGSAPADPRAEPPTPDPDGSAAGTPGEPEQL